MIKNKSFISIPSFEKTLKHFLKISAIKQYKKIYEECLLDEYGFMDPMFIEFDLAESNFLKLLNDTHKAKLTKLYSSFKRTGTRNNLIQVSYTFEKDGKRSENADKLVFRVFIKPENYNKTRVARWTIDIKKPT